MRKRQTTETAPATTPAPDSDRISGKHGGLVPLKFWQRSFQIDVVPDPTAPYVVQRGGLTYLDTSHKQYTRWLVGFVQGASRAVDDALKRKMN